MNKMKADSATVDSRAAWIAAGAALAIMTIAYGAPLLAAVAMKPIAAEFGTDRAAPAAAAAADLRRRGLRRHRRRLAGRAARHPPDRDVRLRQWSPPACVLSASGGMSQLYVGHGLLMGLFGTSCMFSPVVTYVSRWFDRRRGRPWR